MNSLINSLHEATLANVRRLGLRYIHDTEVKSDR